MLLTVLMSPFTTAGAEESSAAAAEKGNKMGLGVMLPGLVSSYSALGQMATGALSLRLQTSDTVAVTGLFGFGFGTGSAPLSASSFSSSLNSNITAISLGALVDFTVAHFQASRTRMYLGIGGSWSVLSISTSSGATNGVSIPSTTAANATTIGILPHVGVEQRLSDHVSLNGGFFVPVGISTNGVSSGSTTIPAGSPLLSLGISPFLSMYLYF